MKNYDTYLVEDFFQDIYFRKWVLDKLPPDDPFWPDWQASNPARRATLEEAKALILAFQCEEIPTDPEEVDTAITAILSEVQSGKQVPFYQTTWFKLCASVVLAMGLFLWVNNELTSTQNGTSPDIAHTIPANDGTLPKVRTNRSDKVQRLVLRDGTRVLLDTASTIQVSEDFGQDKREVFLTGSAEFDVVKNPHKPFLVHTGELVTKVLGTSFRVRAYSRDTDVHIAVKTGKVTVFKNKKTPFNTLSEEMILTPNQEAVYLKSDHTLIKTIVRDPIQVHKPVRFRNFEYNEAPIPLVLNDLEEIYGVRIFFDEQLMEECNLTAKLTNEPLFVKLTMICETIQAHYEVIDGQVVISGGRCN